MKLTVASVLRSAADLLFPLRCVHCGADGSLFCEKCERESTRLHPGSLCRKCALPSRIDVCEACFAVPPALDRAIPVFAYDPAVRDAVSALKYRDIRALAPRLGRLMAETLPEPVRSSVDAVVPVPISRSRLRSRGYNQSELLARQVAGLTGLAMDTGLLARSNDGPPQAKAASIEERIANVRGAFDVAGDVTGKRVLLVDDVMTTGSTLNACARALKQAGAEWAGALPLAREL